MSFLIAVILCMLEQDISDDMYVNTDRVLSMDAWIVFMFLRCPLVFVITHNFLFVSFRVDLNIQSFFIE